MFIFAYKLDKTIKKAASYFCALVPRIQMSLTWLLVIKCNNIYVYIYKYIHICMGWLTQYQHSGKNDLLSVRFNMKVSFFWKSIIFVLGGCVVHPVYTLKCYIYFLVMSHKILDVITESMTKTDRFRMM